MHDASVASLCHLYAGGVAVLPDDVSREAARNALASLPRIERVICGPLIRRQLARNPRAEREIAKYGPAGEVRLCSARALGICMYPVIFMVIGLSLAGANVAAGVAMVLVVVLSIFAISRVFSASAAGRRWRSGRSSSLTGEPPVDTHR
jgi:hypothetical protein